MRPRLTFAWRAARDFVRGFLGMPAPRLDARGETVRHALEARAGRRRSCC